MRSKANAYRNRGFGKVCELSSSASTNPEISATSMGYLESAHQHFASVAAQPGAVVLGQPAN